MGDSYKENLRIWSQRTFVRFAVSHGSVLEREWYETNQVLLGDLGNGIESFSIFAWGIALLGLTSPRLLHPPLKRQASIHSAIIVSRELC
jgi:formate-dependent nitrite reductase membrane component NrfD